MTRATLGSAAMPADRTQVNIRTSQEFAEALERYANAHGHDRSYTLRLGFYVLASMSLEEKHEIALRFLEWNESGCAVDERGVPAAEE